jgi:hypothetical protein
VRVHTCTLRYGGSDGALAFGRQMRCLVVVEGVALLTLEETRKYVSFASVAAPYIPRRDRVIPETAAG